MKRLGWVVLVLAFMAAALGGCSKANVTSFADPETGVRLVLEACWLEKYDTAARYFVGGREAWEHSPEFVKQFLNHICDQGKALTFKVEAEEIRETGKLLQVTTFADQQRRKPLRTLTWHFVRTGRAWTIEKVD